GGDDKPPPSGAGGDLTADPGGGQGAGPPPPQDPIAPRGPLRAQLLGGPGPGGLGEHPGGAAGLLPAAAPAPGGGGGAERRGGRGKRLGFVALLQVAGQEVYKYVEDRRAGDESTLPTVGDVREAVALAAAGRRLADSPPRGQGAWRGRESTLVVNGSEALKF